MRRSLVSGGAAALIAAAAVSSTSPGAHAASSNLGFGTPTVSGVQGYGFEQGVRVAPDGTIYTTSPDSLSSLTSWVWKSTDGGKTFKWVAAAVQPQGKPPSCPGGGDSELDVDSAGHLYLNDLTLFNFSTSRSDDGGTTFTASCTGVPGAGVDRQWYASYGDPTNGGYLALAFDQIDQGNSVTCPAGQTASASGNVLTFGLSPAAPAPGATAGVEFGPLQALSCDEGIMGNDEIHNYGTLGGLKAFVVHDNAALTSVSMSRCDVVGVSATAPTGFANCQDKLVSSFPGFVTGANFPTMTVDSAGNLFAVWEEAAGTAAGAITGNTLLHFAQSNDQGNTWTAAQQLPTPGLLQNVMAWPAAGDSGRIDVAWYGTPQAVAGTAGPDSTPADYSLYFTQTLDSGHTWSAPLQASEHVIHHGTMYTLIGSQTGDRTLGDFIQLRIGTHGQAVISYGDSNNIDEATTPQAMVVQQDSGPSVLASQPMVSGFAPQFDAVTDPAGDATYASAGQTSGNLPNLDILASSVSQPDATHYLITMKVADLTSLTPPPTGGGPDLVWLTQWHVPAAATATDTTGGKIFFAYMESTGGQAPSCYDGQNATESNGGGVLLTYPGVNTIPAAGCSYTATAPGTISITVPISDVTDATATSSTLYSVTASTMSLAAPANSTPSIGGIGGLPFNLIDSAPAYDFVPGTTASVPEAPLTAGLLVGGAVALASAAIGRRRRRRPATT